MQDKENKLHPQPPAWALQSLVNARVGHLACSTKHGIPLDIPICFAFDGSIIYSSIDEKPKRAAPLALRRVSNIKENANVCLTVDTYSEDWRKLQYVLVLGRAKVAQRGKKFPEAVALLRRKYHQYSSMKLETRPLVTIRPLRIVAWKSTTTPRTVKPKEYD